MAKMVGMVRQIGQCLCCPLADVAVEQILERNRGDKCEGD